MSDHGPQRTVPVMVQPLDGESQLGEHDAAMSDFNHNTMQDQPSHDNRTDQTPSEDALRIIGADSRKLIAFIQNIEALGIKNTLPSLPRFVVVGDQSAGKSSIIEATCDIKLPRSQGTCTRCPFKITTTSSKGNAWVCNISVHQKYHYEEAAEGKSPYRNWVEDDDVVITNIATIHTKDEIGLVLRKAQIAILNPSLRPNEFIDLDISLHLESKDMESDNLIEVAFSPNWVALEISSPELPELSLYDLPGAITVHSDAPKQHLIVQFIEDLLKNYMEEDKTLILLACPMNADIQTSTAFSYIRQCNASSRSMGVRTKPDTVPITAKRLEEERPILMGEKHVLGGGGWYITRQCSQEELDQGNINHADARRIEKEFFENQLWQDVLGGFNDRLGTPRLQAALSERLTQHIRGDLPTIMERIIARRLAVQEELARYPKPEENAVIVVLKEISGLHHRVKNCMSLDAIGSDVFANRFRQLFKDFSKELQNCTPELNVVTPGWVPTPIEVDDGSGVSDPSPTKKQKVTHNRAVAAPDGNSKTKQKRTTTKSKSTNAAPSPTPSKFILHLDEFKDKLDAAPGANIPNQLDDRVVRQAMLESLQGWPAAVAKLHNETKKLIREVLNECLQQMNVQRRTGLRDAVKTYSLAFHENAMTDQENRISNALSCELDVPFTVSKNFGPELATVKKIYQDRRNAQRVKEYFDAPPAGVRLLNEPDQAKKAQDSQWIESNLGSDNYEREITGFVRIVAYYNTVYPQLVDQLSKSTQYHLVRQFADQLFERLQVDLKISDQKHCEELLAADVNVQRQIHSLTTEEEKLNDALRELQLL